MTKINILGSCVSRVSLLDGDQKGHGIADEDMELGYFFDKQNMVLCQMPAPFTKEEVATITVEELWDKSRIHVVHQSLNKDTLPMLMESDADYLVIDLMEFQTYFAVYGKTAFDTNAFEFMNTGLYQKYASDIRIANFLEMDEWIYYPYIDLFFGKVMTKYDADHIILNRFRANSYFLGKDGQIKNIPDAFKNKFQANDRFNYKLRQLEDYIIKKVNPYVIDISKYYMGCEQDWSNVQGAHFEKGFYHHTLDLIRHIINDKPTERVFDKAEFFTGKYPESYECDIDNLYNTMMVFLDNEEILWMNILDKLYSRMPENEELKGYVEACKDL